MEHFLKSGLCNEYSLCVEENGKTDKQKVCDIIQQSKKKTLDCSMGVYMQNKQGPVEFNAVGADLFTIMSPSPDPTMKSRRQRDVIFISAPSGSGKSTWAGQYARSYQSTPGWVDEPISECARPRRSVARVVVFSAVKEDPAFEGVKLKRVCFEDLVDEDGEPNDILEIEDLSDSLVIFDDIDVIANKKLKKWIQDLRNRCLEIGRHHNINLICTTHQLMNYNETKILLMEATKVVVFPKSGSEAQIKRYLKTYADFTPDAIKKLFKLNSRWVMINKSAPRYVLHAGGVYLG